MKSRQFPGTFQLSDYDSTQWQAVLYSSPVFVFFFFCMPTNVHIIPMCVHSWQGSHACMSTINANCTTYAQIWGYNLFRIGEPIWEQQKMEPTDVMILFRINKWCVTVKTPTRHHSRSWSSMWGAALRPSESPQTEKGTERFLKQVFEDSHYALKLLKSVFLF